MDDGKSAPGVEYLDTGRIYATSVGGEPIMLAGP
jgi:hypothetical protein